ncbi:cell division protein ZapE [Brevibacterium jeotgali]|uniref:cell division protein ZapE n=1 Tax=Brevibacterium jeotgali TaxID=1262550 RepID=UPI000C78A0DD|nr:cell division protein ZapE [Brevibacterium jeotgali]
MSTAQIIHLSEADPRISPDELIDGLVPPPQFEDVSFGSYRPDPAQPTQTQARDTLNDFVSSGGGSSRLLGRLFGGGRRSKAKGVYLDGGYGVGKTHLLASTWHASEKPATFGTFVEYTNLIGALGFVRARDELSQMRLVCIDEFELDDPGDTVMMSRLMRELTDAGVKIVATSNTLPGSLGQGRFAAQDFLREIQALSEQFTIVSIDGDDYRSRGLPEPPAPQTTEELDAVLAEATGTVARDRFDVAVEHLSTIHPSRYGRMLDQVDTIVWDEVRTIENEGVALRFVALVDRMYDRDVAVHASGVKLDDVFTDEMIAGGYRKKYLRCLSRLTALAHKARS